MEVLLDVSFDTAITTRTMVVAIDALHREFGDGMPGGNLALLQWARDRGKRHATAASRFLPTALPASPARPASRRQPSGGSVAEKNRIAMAAFPDRTDERTGTVLPAPATPQLPQVAVAAPSPAPAGPVPVAAPTPVEVRGFRLHGRAPL
jgi:hypothetical protein